MKAAGMDTRRTAPRTAPRGRKVAHLAAEEGVGQCDGEADSAPPGHDAPRGLDQSCLDHLLGYQVTRANIACRKVFANHIGSAYRLSPVEFTILMLVAHNRDVSQKQLSQALAVSAPNVTALLDRLAERELLVRVRSESDRRSQHVSLTRKGAALVRDVRAVSLTMESHLLGPLSPAERGTLFDLLQKVAWRRP